MKKIYCIGGATIDRKIKALNSIQIDTSNPATSSVTYGGVARNVAENLSRWTTEVHLQTIIGNDAEGAAILQHLQKCGIDTSACLSLNHQRTAHYYAVIEQHGALHSAFADMEIFSYASHTMLEPHWQQWEKNSIVFLDTNFPTETLQHFIVSHASQHMLCIDPVSVVKALRLPRDLRDVYLLKPNHQEAEVLSGMTIKTSRDCKNAGKEILKRGVANVIISLGKNGYMLMNEHTHQHFTVEKINTIRDATGAGDAFVAGIIYGLQKEKDLVTACKQGTTAATFALQTEDSVVSPNQKENICSNLSNIQKKLRKHSKIENLF